MLVVAVALGAVGIYLVRRPPPAVPVAEKPSAVDATTVDLPGNPPQAAPAAPAPTLPAPTPSRPASGAIAAAPSRARPAARGSVLIRSTPAGADVLLNGSARGKTPLTVRDLPLGSYTIRIAREGYAAEDRKVQLTAQRPTASMVVTLPARRSLGEGGRPAPAPGMSGVGSLTVQSRPAGARVFVNDRLIGSTPLAIPGLPAGPATVRIDMEGYRTWITTVRVNAGKQAKVAASLDRR